jgi:dolichol-phosphate mannosyltransferase
MGRKSVNVSIIIPTYKEAENLGKLIPLLQTTLAKENLSFEILIVDDNSEDGTVALVQKFAVMGVPVTLHIRTQERGLASAVVFGMRKAKGEIFVCMDADLSHPPQSVPQLIEPLQEKKPPDMVIGSRFTKGGKVDEQWSIGRRVNSTVASFLAAPLIPKNVTDPMAGFFAVKKTVFKRNPHLKPIGYKIALEIMLKCACLRVQEIPITFMDREMGVSKLNMNEQVNYLKHLRRLYDFKYPRFSSGIKFLLVNFFGFLLNWLTFFTLVPQFSMVKLVLIFAYLPTLGVSAVFYYRYRKSHRNFLMTSTLEFLSVAGFIFYAPLASPIDPMSTLLFMTGTGVTTRILIRKFLGQNLLGPSPIPHQF